jgi:hypothetical protein
MQALDELLKRLGSEYTFGYGPTPIPSAIDEEVVCLLNLVLGLAPAQHELVLKKMTEDHGFVFLAYAERMASQIVREQQPTSLCPAMTAIALAIQLIYVKEALPVISLLFHSIEKLGSRACEQILSASPLKNEALHEYLDEFTRRAADDRSIEAMGYVEGRDSDGFRYIRTW